MIKPNNPWAGMHPNATRRVDHNTSHDFHWVKDKNSRFGLLVIFKSPNDELELVTKIQGITIIKRLEDSLLEFYLIINNNDDWELFYSLCNDLINVAAECSDDQDLIKALNSRLKRWQKFLSQGKSFSMTEIQQMGLIAELNFLVNILAKKTTLQHSIQAWVGPDFDRQDFSIENALFEIKSFISSKGPFIRISSLHQLNFNIKPLYLVAYGLTRNDNGISIIDVINQINQLFQDTDAVLRDEFENKLAQYGFLSGITEPPFYKWIIDLGKIYSVVKDFPKLLAADVPSEIVSAEYSIDLSKCRQFETDINTVFLK